MRLHDAHNHLHDERFRGRQGELVDACRAEGVVKMVVNGSGEEDWPQVAVLAGRFPGLVIPSFGCHPWYVAERTEDWQQTLTGFLDSTPRAVVGEIGLDRWKPGLDYSGQEEVFVWQLRLAAERDLPASIHCLQAWGRLFELLRQHPRPRCGFLLHSYGGPAEMVAPLAKLGAYFGFPGYFMHARKARQREVFRRVPSDRLLIETDAPDQPLPVEEGRGPRDEAETARETPVPKTALADRPLVPHSLTDFATSQPLNHPANLARIYRFVALMLNESVEELAARAEDNFRRVFGER